MPDPPVGQLGGPDRVYPRPQGGWSFLGGAARKAHYFPSPERGTAALCGKWAIWKPHDLLADDGPSPDDCVSCRRKLNAKAAQ